MDPVGEANLLVARSGGIATDPENRPPAYKAVGLTLAVASGVFIGVSFVLKKKGLLNANAKYNEEAGEGYGYLKNAFWWAGMILMIIGEICNFVAYAFVDAILVTPLGALSVVITTILSAIFLKERLSFVGKVGCFNCIIGSVVIVMNAPEQSAVSDIQDMQDYVLSPGFLCYAGIVIIGCTFIAVWAGPKYGKKTMLVYLTICSLIGGLSVVATQGLGSAIVAQASGKPQFNQWFLYVLLVFVIATLVTEIVYLNKALNLFNAALVTPTYYVIFTSATIVTSAILFRGFHGTAISIATVIMGFLQICAGVVLLQLSKSAKDVPDAAVFKGDLDQVRTVAEQEQPESEPKADAIRGTSAIIRRISQSRQKWEQDEARRLHDEKMQDQMEPIGENEVVEWDGLRRRKTVVGESPMSPRPRRQTTIHPPLGMSHFPDPEEEGNRNTDDEHPRGDQQHGVFEALRNRASSVLMPRHRNTISTTASSVRSPMHPVPLTEISVNPSKADVDSPAPYSQQDDHPYGLQSRPSPSPSHLAPTPPPHQARRQFSFQNVFHRTRSGGATSPNPDSSPNVAVQSSPNLPSGSSRLGLGSRQSSKDHAKFVKNATEEEKLGLVKGDSHTMFHDAQRPKSPSSSPSPTRENDRRPFHHYSSSEDADVIDDYDDDIGDVVSEEGWQIMTSTSTPPRIPMHKHQPPPPRYQEATATSTSSSSGRSITWADRSKPPSITTTQPRGLPAHPAINVHVTGPSPDRNQSPPFGNQRVAADTTQSPDEYDYDQRRQWDRQAQQQGYFPPTSQHRPQRQGSDERDITGGATAPVVPPDGGDRNKLRKKPRREGSGDSGSSIEEVQLRDYDRSGRKGGAFV